MQATETREKATDSPPVDFLPINAVDHIEFWVGNARQAAHYYRSAFGMKLTAYSGPETGIRDRASYVLEQEKIRFVLTTPLQSDGAIADHIRVHGDGVRDIALTVDDAARSYGETTLRGARGVREPFTLRDDSGEVRLASIAAYGDTVHTFVERRNYRGPFLPGFRAVDEPDRVSRPAGLKYIDHMVGNVGWRQMNTWVKFYEDVMGFRL
ncbi:MAG TPA: VOC family protein, partial [Bryobacteraceae bacterium]|nr:VOC family protein [Bryobacteraceae bacterium]